MSTPFEPATFLAQIYYRLQEAFFGSESYQPRPKLTLDCVIKSRIGQLQAEGILPVQPTAHGIGSLPIRQIFHKLENGDQGA